MKVLKSNVYVGVLAINGWSIKKIFFSPLFGKQKKNGFHFLSKKKKEKFKKLSGIRLHICMDILIFFLDSIRRCSMKRWWWWWWRWWWWWWNFNFDFQIFLFKFNTYDIFFCCCPWLNRVNHHHHHRNIWLQQTNKQHTGSTRYLQYIVCIWWCWYSRCDHHHHRHHQIGWKSLKNEQVISFKTYLCGFELAYSSFYTMETNFEWMRE